jgi:hypothetical protein
MNAIVRLPAGITDTQSYSWVLRETFLATLTPLFPGYTILRNNRVPIQRTQLPVLGVYLMPERMTHDGDWDAGDIRFTHDFALGFSVIIADNDSDAVEQKLDAAWWTIMNGLWPNVGLTNMQSSSAADNTRIEGSVSGTRRFVYGAIGLNNETPVAELQYETTCRYRTSWAPTITDDFNLMVVQVVPAGVDSSQTQIIQVQYDLASTG